LAVCLNISTVINIKNLTISNQQTQSYIFNSHITDFLSVVLMTEMLEICIHTSYDQNVQLILKSYLPVVYGTHLRKVCKYQKGKQKDVNRNGSDNTNGPRITCSAFTMNWLTATKYPFLKCYWIYFSILRRLSFLYYQYDFYLTWLYEKYGVCLIRSRNYLLFREHLHPLLVLVSY
jgi:hypothetical protein